MRTAAAAVRGNLICIVLFCIIFLTAFECRSTQATDHNKCVSEERTKCMGGLERWEDLPSVVMVRWNSPANHLVLSRPIEPMLENWPITGHFSSPGIGSVWSYSSWYNQRRRRKRWGDSADIFLFHNNLKWCHSLTKISFIHLLFSCNTLILNHLDIFTADFFPKLTIVFNCLQGALSYMHSLNMSPLWLKHLFNTAVFRNANCLALHCHTSNIFDRCEDGMTVRGVTLFNSRAQLYER